MPPGCGNVPRRVLRDLPRRPAEGGRRHQAAVVANRQDLDGVFADHLVQGPLPTRDDGGGEHIGRDDVGGCDGHLREFAATADPPDVLATLGSPRPPGASWSW